MIFTFPGLTHPTQTTFVYWMKMVIDIIFKHQVMRNMQNIVTELLVINVFLGNEQFKSHYKEEELRQGDDHKNFVHAFNAYAPAGTVTGQLVYVNYAR